MFITFEQAKTAFENLTVAELFSLAFLKALEETNGEDFMICKSCGLNPFYLPIQKENITILRDILVKKHGNFFGFEVDVRGRNLELLIDYMAAEFRNARAEGRASAGFMLLEQEICVSCAKEILQAIDVLQQKAAYRFSRLAFDAARQHVLRAIEIFERRLALEMLFASLEEALFGGNFIVVDISNL